MWLGLKERYEYLPSLWMLPWPGGFGRVGTNVSMTTHEHFSGVFCPKRNIVSVYIILLTFYFLSFF